MNKDDCRGRVEQEGDPSLQYAWRIIGSLAHRLKYLETWYQQKGSFTRRGNYKITFSAFFLSLYLHLYYIVPNQVQKKNQRHHLLVLKYHC